jgi:ATP-dependent DNA helicase RecQ
MEKVMEAFQEHGSAMLRPVFDALGGEVSYEELRMLRLYHLSLLNPMVTFKKSAAGNWPQVCRIICLANSRKYSGRCIAGKMLNDDVVGGWIRPVGETASGELSRGRITLENGETPNLLDILTVQLQEPVPHTYQSENHLVGASRWTRKGTWPISRVSELVDTPDRLWVNGYHSLGGRNDRMPTELTDETLSTSLLFIQPNCLVFTVHHDSKGLNKLRAKFAFNGDDYWMAVTDPIMESLYLPLDVGHYPTKCARPFVTVSISEPYEGFCYKLAAALVLPPDEESSA